MEKKLTLLWGAKAISKAIDRPVRATFTLLESGEIPGRKIGRRWVVTEEALQRFFADMPTGLGNDQQSRRSRRRLARMARRTGEAGDAATAAPRETRGPATIFKMSPNSNDSSPPVPESVDFQIERPDWTQFRSLGTIGQKAGVPAGRLRRLALKELVDNALDAGGQVTLWQPQPGHYVIEDDGPGIDGSPEQVARLFSIDRGLVSSKLWRKPLRGALGNGLRVVAGALIASGGGSLIVTTRNQRLAITPQEDGGAAVTAGPADFPVGAKIEISFGRSCPRTMQHSLGHRTRSIWPRAAEDTSASRRHGGLTPMPFTNLFIARETVLYAILSPISTDVPAPRPEKLPAPSWAGRAQGFDRPSRGA